MKYEQLAKTEEIKFWIGHNLKKYLEKNIENQSQIEHIIDYLHSDKAPTRIKKMSYKEALSSSEKWLKALIKKGANIEECEDVDYDVIIDFNDGFKLVKLKSETAFSREGNLMAHCVGSYFNKDGDIYSLRDSKNMPHCTLEIEKDASSFNQCKGKGNGSIHNKYIKYILDTMKHFNISMRSSEMRNLGYFYLDNSAYSNKQIKWFNCNFKDNDFIILDSKKYYYMG